MSSEHSEPPIDPSDRSRRAGGGDRQAQLEERATAFVFGELNREEATEFMKAMDSSPSLRAMVDSIRDAVGALKIEFADTEGWVEESDRKKIEDAIRSQSPEAPPVISDGGEEGSRNWAMALAVAATLLLVCGLTFPGLNKVITANTNNAELQEQIQQNRVANERLLAENKYLAGQLVTIQRDLKKVSESLSGALPTGTPSQIRRSVEEEDPVLASTSSDVDRTDAGGMARTDNPSRTGDVLERHEIGQGDSIAKTVVGNGDQDAEGQVKPGQTAVASPDSVARSGDSGMENVAGAGQAIKNGEANGNRAATGLPTGRNPMLGQMNPSRTRTWNPDPDGAGPADLASSGDSKRMLEMLDESDQIAAVSGGLGGGSQDRKARMPRDDNYIRKNGGPSRIDLWMEDLLRDRLTTIVENSFEPVIEQPLSAFSVEANKASYAVVRSELQRQKRLPEPNAIRIEEMVNYFDYHYEPPSDNETFAAAIDVAECPWNRSHRLARIGIKGATVEEDRPPSNLVFLIDVSGSMNRPNRMPLVLDGLKMLVGQLDENDSVAIIVYAGASGLVLDSTKGDRKKDIHDALERLKAGGSTVGGEGIQLAYSIARENFVEDGTNRVIVCSDGDLDVGLNDTDELVRLVEKNSESGLSLTVLGFGVGDQKDEVMATLSKNGKGSYVAVSNEDEARKVMVEQVQGTLMTIAKDVKIQVEFNPMEVEAYRLIGCENRMLTATGFRDASEEAVEIGAGHTVTALYEIIPRDDAGKSQDDRDAIRSLKYQRRFHFTEKANSGELLTVKLAYYRPDGEQGQDIEFAVKDSGKRFEQTDGDFQFATAVAAFGMLLRDSPYKGDASFEMVEEIASVGAIDDRSGYRDEFVSLVRQARTLAGG